MLFQPECRTTEFEKDTYFVDQSLSLLPNVLSHFGDFQRWKTSINHQLPSGFYKKLIVRDYESLRNFAEYPRAYWTETRNKNDLFQSDTATLSKNPMFSITFRTFSRPFPCLVVFNHVVKLRPYCFAVTRLHIT